MKYAFALLAICTSCHATEPAATIAGDAEVIGFPDPVEIATLDANASEADSVPALTGDPLDDLTAGRRRDVFPVLAADHDAGYDATLRGRIEAASGTPHPARTTPPIIRDPPPPARPPGSCNPPYMIDAEGKKMYKVECL